MNLDIGCIQVFEGIGSILFMFYVLIVWCEKYIIIISLNFILKFSITKKGYIIWNVAINFSDYFPHHSEYGYCYATAEYKLHLRLLWSVSAKKIRLNSSMYYLDWI